jgi:hypothetical protein
MASSGTRVEDGPDSDVRQQFRRGSVFEMLVSRPSRSGTDTGSGTRRHPQNVLAVLRIWHAVGNGSDLRVRRSSSRVISSALPRSRR